MIIKKSIFTLLAFCLLLVSSLAQAADHAVVIMYHRFGEAKYPSTNISLEEFDAHLEELASGGYTVLPLAEIVEKIKTNIPLADKTVAITVDDAFLSVYQHAFPRLRDYGFPFTLFVATRAIDQNFPDYASWAQIREMQAAGVDIGSQAHAHPHLPKITLADARADIVLSNQRFLDELGIMPVLHAYPYGEYTPAIRDLVQELGFEAAFGQHSGVLHSSVNRFQYPRFSFNERYGSIERLKTAINALPIPTSDITPESMVLNENPPLVGFSLIDETQSAEDLSCFASDMGRVPIVALGNRVEVRLPQPFAGNRGRLNCTLPHVENGQRSGRFHWFGQQFILP